MFKDLFLDSGYTRGPFHSQLWYKILSETDEYVKIIAFDIPYAKPRKISWREFDTLHIRGGLWKRTGLYQFDRADDPAIKDIIFCSRYPQAAGRELYKLRRKDVST